MPGDEIPDPNTTPPPPRDPGDPLLIIERVLVDSKERQRGMTVRGTILRTFRGPDDVLWALQSHYKLQKGVINTQSVFRFNDLDSANGVTFAIVGGDRQVQESSRHGDAAAGWAQQGGSHLQGLLIGWLAALFHRARSTALTHF